MLKHDVETGKRLRRYLLTENAKLDQLISEGSAPLFGYPAILYENAYDDQSFLSRVYEYVQNERKTGGQISITKLVKAQRDEQ
jgi:hypothetical protein